MSIILDNLILCSFEESFNRELLVKNKITHILNVARECEISDRINLIYKKISIADDCPDTDISTIFTSCNNFIKEVHLNGGNIIIHCLEGISRSVCVTLCYMVQILNWDFKEAYLHIYRIRPIIDIYPKYLDQTLDFISNKIDL